MDEQAAYRWLDQQGEAFGAPGAEPRWTSSEKDAVGTAYAASSRIWFTASHGILNEIYHPTIDRPQVRDMEFLITDGESFAHEEKRDLIHDFEYIHPDALGVRYTNRDPEGRYKLVKEIICDPHHSVVLQRVHLEADEAILSRLKVYAMLAPRLGGRGMGNTGRAIDIAGHKMLLATSEGNSLAMTTSCGFSRVSCGFVGSSDGWHDIMDNFQMDWEFGSATNGNIALFGEVQLSACEAHGGCRVFTLAIGIGGSNHTALEKTVSVLSKPYAEHRERFIKQWQRVESPNWLAAKSRDEGRLMRASHNVLLAHEDKTYSGAFVASASIPWGQAHGDDDLGGYHLVWTRDMVQTASALLACGRAETARRALVYLACTQKPDGGFAQNFWIDGRPYWSGVQLDEVAFPIILAWRLWKENALGEMDIFPFVERAAGFLVRHAPITHQERWEENAGYSPSTLAAVVGGLICAAEICHSRMDEELAHFLYEFADWIESHIEEWTVTNDGVLLPEVKRHYMRVRPPEQGDAYFGEGAGTEKIHINNRPPSTQTEFEAREIIDAGFLELVRYGVRSGDDPLIAESLRVVDAVLKRGLPQGPGWLRYNFDGYGQRPDGGPFKGWGQGRVWPLLTGERAHYELAAGRDVSALIETIERFASVGNLLPEQVWDESDRPEQHLLRGKPAGSAVPLVWAHAEYLKLLRSVSDGRIFDRIEPVYQRYATAEGRTRARKSIEIFSLKRPIQRINAGATLRILNDERFDVEWTTDNWQSKHRSSARSLGELGFSVDLDTFAYQAGERLIWTLEWVESGAWLGRDVEILLDGN
jgi:glucoamylase